MNLITQFNEAAKHYDELREKLIPCYHEFYNVASRLAYSEKDSPRILDLGAGTGLLSRYIAEKYTSGYFTLIDLSEAMLDIAKLRFKHQERFQYILADYTTYPYEEKYDLIVSSLSIHHLTDEEKEALYQNVYNLLDENGIFINADQVLGHSEFLDDIYKSEWKTSINQSGLTSDQLAAAIERTKLDKMAGLNEQLMWLSNAGFTHVDCMYKYFNFVVMYAKK